MHEYRIRELTFQVFTGDISLVSADAIVCPANSFGVMRGGASQALRHRGGDIIEEEAKRLAPIPLGNAVATSAGKLSARWVIHAPALRDPVENSNAGRILQAATAATGKAISLGARSIAFPAIGAGVGEVSFPRAAKALLDGILICEPRLGNLRLIKLVARTQAMENAFISAIVNANEQTTNSG